MPPQELCGDPDLRAQLLLPAAERYPGKMEGRRFLKQAQNTEFKSQLTAKLISRKQEVTLFFGLLIAECRSAFVCMLRVITATNKTQAKFCLKQSLALDIALHKG